MKPTTKLLISFAFYAVALPIASFLQNVYIWRVFNDTTYLVFFNIGQYLLVPIAFLLNGKLLGKVSNTKLFFFGGLLLGIINVILITIQIRNQLEIAILGAIYGLGFGFYWANRNNLSLKLTHDDNRTWFLATDSLVRTLTNIIIPIAVGFVIVLLENTYLVPIKTIYTYFAIVYLVFVIAGPLFLLNDNNFDFATDFKLTKVNFSFYWKTVIFGSVQIGFFSELNKIISPILVLAIIGKEFEIGSIQTIATIFTVITLYLISKYLKKHHRIRVYTVGIVVLVLAALLNMLLLNSFSVVIYIGLAALVQQLIWVCTEPITMRIIEIESENHHVNTSVFQFERELYLSIGRVAGMLLMLALYTYGGNNLVLRSLMLIIACIQIPGIYIWRKASQKLHLT